MKTARQSIFVPLLLSVATGMLFYIELHDPYTDLYRHEIVRIIRLLIAELPVLNC